MKRSAPSPPTSPIPSPPAKIPAYNKSITPQIQLWVLPEEVLGIISEYLDKDDLLDLSLTSKQFYNIAEKCYKDLFRSVWKSDPSCIPLNNGIYYSNNTVIMKNSNVCYQL